MEENTWRKGKKMMPYWHTRDKNKIKLCVDNTEISGRLKIGWLRAGGSMMHRKATVTKGGSLEDSGKLSKVFCAH